MFDKKMLEDQVAALKSKQKKMKTAGIALIPIGAGLILLGIVVYVVSIVLTATETTDATSLAFGIPLFILFLTLGMFLVPGGIVLLVLSKTVLKNKINNRLVKIDELSDKEEKAETVDAKVVEPESSDTTPAE